MDKFKGKYRNESARLQHWDYGNNAAYYITICTKDRAHHFGEIINGKLKISLAGAIAYVLWYEIKNHAKNIRLGEFVVMPNHVHGILILDAKMGIDGQSSNDGRLSHDGQSSNDGESSNVGTTHALSLHLTSSQQWKSSQQIMPSQNLPPYLQSPLSLRLELCLQTKNEISQQPTLGQQRFQHQGKNTISSIIGSYKSAVTKYCNRLGLPSGWQPRFYDHIIRDKASFKRITQYIIDNPANWKEDRFNG